jgi:para-nitrobenzyl esterase
VVEAGAAAVRKLASGGGSIRGASGSANWGPTVDGKTLPHHAFDPTAPSVSANVPMIVSTVLNEMTTAAGHPEYEDMREAEVRKRLEERFPGKGAIVFSAYRKLYPAAKPFDVLSVAQAGPSRQSAVTQAERKAALNAAPAYLCWFTHQSPALEGRLRAYHCAELPFVFYNMDRCEKETGGSEAVRKLSGKMADAWANFARKGNPNHPAIPKWTPFSTETAPTMVFDLKCELKNDPDGEARKSIAGG